MQFWKCGSRGKPNSKQRMINSIKTLRFFKGLTGDKVVLNVSAVVVGPLQSDGQIFDDLI
jgi:hypothetical protein